MRTCSWSSRNTRAGVNAEEESDAEKCKEKKEEEKKLKDKKEEKKTEKEANVKATVEKVELAWRGLKRFCTIPTVNMYDLLPTRFCDKTYFTLRKWHFPVSRNSPEDGI